MTICVDGQTMQVPTASWPAYQSQGATQGACAENKITICHFPPGNPANPQTLEISPSAWSAHQSQHSDIQGPCNMTPMTICKNNQSMQIPTSSWPLFQAQGATQGGCPEGGQGKPNGGTVKPVEGSGGKTAVKPGETKITICHFPPENPKAPVTMQVTGTEWIQHAKHGDKQGACPPAQSGGKTLPK
jgi:hypothetical protein